ncbi:hypothetical protein LCGC14_0364500 [marine sediment metagenome]|uniref:GIY-YIG domain-containing protein n=1 Tax=marine sediment metagenome TaxID=412755 RepID=A0A0F9WFA3_9ZZZZ
MIEKRIKVCKTPNCDRLIVYRNGIPISNMIIYKVTNKINGKFYVGQTINGLAWRKNEHLKSAQRSVNNHFHSALIKHGKENFNWEVLCICYSVNVLNEMEQHYIALYNSMNDGYNMTSGGENYTVSEETREKMRKANAGKNNPMYGKKRDLKGEKHPHYGIKNTVETKKKMSDARILYLKNNPDKILKGKNNPMWGRKMSEETKTKMINNLPDRKGKNNAFYGKKHTEETIKKMKIAQRKWRDEAKKTL